MPIPVTIPSGALAVTASENTRVELFVAKFAQLMEFGTSGLTVSSRPAAEASTYPDGTDPTSLTSVIVDTDKKQLYFRTLGFALLKAIAPIGAASQSNGSTSAPTTSSASFVTIPEMTSTVTTNGGNVLVVFSSSFNIVAADSFDFAIFLDGTEVTTTRRTASCATAIANYNGSTQALLIAPSAGSHTIDVRWKANAGSARAITTERNLVVMENY